MCAPAHGVSRERRIGKRGNMDESATPSVGSERTVRILEPGVREIGRHLLYSAAWLDDRYPESEPDKPVRALHWVAAPGQACRRNDPVSG